MPAAAMLMMDVRRRGSDCDRDNNGSSVDDYRTITVERPERDAAGAIGRGTKGAGKGKPVANADLRDTDRILTMIAGLTK